MCYNAAVHGSGNAEHDGAEATARMRRVAPSGCACKAEFIITAARPAPDGFAIVRVWEAEHVPACQARGETLSKRNRSVQARAYLDLLVSKNLNMGNEWVIRTYQKHFAVEQMATMNKTFAEVQVGCRFVPTIIKMNL